MATITFTGSNKSGYVEYYGVRFPCGEAVETDNADAIELAKHHPEFKLSKKADLFDHDGDGQPGGSKPKGKPGRPRKA